MASEFAKYSEITIDRVKLATSDLIPDLFSYKFSLNIDYDISKLNHFSDAKSVLLKEFPVLQKNLSYFQHLQKKIETFNQKVLYVRDFNYSKIFSKFLRTLSQKISSFYDGFYAKTLEQDPIKDSLPNKDPLKELNFPQLRSRLKDRIIKISNELYSVLSDKPQIVFEEELSNVVEKIIRLNDFLHSNESNVIANMKMNYGSFLMSLCSQRFEDCDYYLCVDHEKISYLLNDARLNLPKHYPIYLSRKKFMLESLHKIVTDDLSFSEKNNKIDIKAVGRAVFQRDRKNIEKDLGDAVRKVIENKDLKDDAEDFKRNIDSLTNEMQRVRLEGEILKENPVFVRLLDGNINVETIGFMDENEQNEELLMNIEKLSCDFYKFMKNVKDLFERMMFFTKEEELFYKNKYFQVLNNIIQNYYTEVAKSNLHTFISSLFTKLEALLFKEKNTIVENELEGKLLTELEKNQDNPYLGHLFSALQEAEKKREVYSKHIKEKQYDFKQEPDLDLEKTKLTKEASNYVYKEAKPAQSSPLMKAKSMQVRDTSRQEPIDFTVISPKNIKKPTIFAKKAAEEEVIKPKAAGPNYDFEKDLKPKKTSMVKLQDEGEIISGKSKGAVSIEDDIGKLSSGRNKNVKFDEKDSRFAKHEQEKEQFLDIENPPPFKRFDDKKGSSKNLLGRGDIMEEEEEDFHSKGKKGGHHKDEESFSPKKGSKKDLLKKNEDDDGYFKKNDDKKSSSRNLLRNVEDEDDNFKKGMKPGIGDIHKKNEGSSHNLIGNVHGREKDDEDFFHKKDDNKSSNRNLLGNMHGKDKEEDDYFHKKDDNKNSSRNLLGNMHGKDKEEDDYFHKKDDNKNSSRNLLGNMHGKDKEDDDDFFHKKDDNKSSSRNLLGNMHGKDDNKGSNRNLLGNIHGKGEDEEDDFMKKDHRKEASSKNLFGGDLSKKGHEESKPQSKNNFFDKPSDRKRPGFDDEEEEVVEGFGGHAPKKASPKRDEIMDSKSAFSKPMSKNNLPEKLPGFDDDEEVLEDFGGSPQKKFPGKRNDDITDSKSGFARQGASKNNLFDKPNSLKKMPGFDEDEEVVEDFGGLKKPSPKKNPDISDSKMVFSKQTKNLLDKPTSQNRLPGFDDEEEVFEDFGNKSSKKSSPKKNDLISDSKKAFTKPKNETYENIEEEEFPPKKDMDWGSLDKKIDKFGDLDDNDFGNKKPIGSHRLSAVREDVNMEKPMAFGLNPGKSEEVIEEKPSKSNFGLERKKNLMSIEKEAKQDDYDTMFMKPPNSKEQTNPLSKPGGFGFTQPENQEDDSPEIIPEYNIDNRKPGGLRPLEKQKAGLIKPIETTKMEKPGLMKLGKLDESDEMPQEKSGGKFETFDDDLNVLDDLLPSGGNKKPPPITTKPASPAKKGLSPLKKGVSPLKKQANLGDFEGDEGFQEEIIEDYQDDFHDDGDDKSGEKKDRESPLEGSAEESAKFDAKPLISKEDLKFIDEYLVHAGIIPGTDDLPTEMMEMLNQFNVIETLLNEAMAQEKAFIFSLDEGEKLSGFLDKFHDAVGKSSKLSALKQCEKELHHVSDLLIQYHLQQKEKMEFDLNSRIFIPFEKPSVPFYLIELFIPAKKIYFYYKKNPDKKAQDKAKNMLIILQEIFKFPENTPMVDIILKDSALKELEKFKKLNYLPLMTTAFQVVYETPEPTHAMTPLLDFDHHTIQRMFAVASTTSQVLQALQGEGLELLLQHFEEDQKALSAGPECLIIDHDLSFSEKFEETDTESLVKSSSAILGGCLQQLSNHEQIFLVLTVALNTGVRFSYYFYFSLPESEEQPKPIMRLFYLVEYDSNVSRLMQEIAASLASDQIAFECYFDFSRHNGLYDFSKISVVVWAENCLKGLNSLDAFRLLSYSLLPFYEATKAMFGEEGEEGMENMAMMGAGGGEGEEEYDEHFEVDEDLLPE